MFVYNVKISSGKIFKIILFFIILIAVIMTGVAIYKVFVNQNTQLTSDEIYTIPDSNFTNVLKAVHENIDTYVGQKISYCGYVYRVYDLTSNEFVLARDMIINSKNQTVVVGFLCNCSNASDFADGTWVNMTGRITKGNYHGDIPIIEILQIEKASKPANAYVYPPDDYYIPTSTLLYNKS